MRRRIPLILPAVLLALLASPAAAAPPPPKDAPPKHTVAQRNYADAPPIPEGFAALSGTVEDDSGDQVAGLTVQKVSCKNSSQTTSNGYEVREGACGLRYSDGLLRGKFRATIYRISTGEAATGNVGWDQSPPHYRRVYAYVGESLVLEAGTQQRGACLGCHSTVAYSLRDCDYPVSINHFATTANLSIRVGGVLYNPFNWNSFDWIGCGI